MKKTQTILGAGIAGLVAAIDLARQGYEVVVLEKGRGIGGTWPFHPSIHGTPVDFDFMRRYVGIDLRPSFQPIERFRAHFGATVYNLAPEGLYVVERGPRKTSIDSYLFTIAEKAGVNFEFDTRVKDHAELRAGSIIATGLHPLLYRSLGIACERFYGAAPRFETDRPTEIVAIFDDSIGDYYYHGVANGILFGHLFQRKKLKPEILERCRAILIDKEGFPDDEWMHTSCVIPGWSAANPRLFAKGKILAGTLSGMIDPLMGFGITGAIFSGKTAAMAVYDPARARRDFKQFTKNWHANFVARKIMERMPLRAKIQEAFLIKAPLPVRRKLLQSGNLAIPGVERYPLMRPIEV